MSDEILFYEKQKMKQWWILIPLIFLNLILFGRAILFFVREKSIIESYFDIFFPLILVLLVTILIISLNLQTMIKNDGIYIRLFPFHLSFRHHQWNELKKIYVRKYNPLSEYGGWGIKGTQKNRAFNLSGNIGLQLEFNDGNKLLIGTNKKLDLTTTLQQLGVYRD